MSDQVTTNSVSSSEVKSTKKEETLVISREESIETDEPKKWKDKKLLYTAYGILILTAFIEAFANDSTKNLDSYATSEFNAHSLIATAAVVYKITAICSYPILAKIADLLGRGEGFGLSVFIYTLAYVLYAACQNVQTYICAEILYAVGGHGYKVYQQIFIADTTNLINRCLYSQIPAALTAIPSLYAGSYVMDAFLEHSTWRWGYGSFGIILGVSVIPLTVVMFIVDHRANGSFIKRKAQILQDLPEGSSFWKKAWWILWNELDLFGGMLMVAGMALFFVPFTLAGSKNSYRWKEGKLIAMLVVGFLLFFSFIVWNTWSGKKPFEKRKAFVPKQQFTNATIVIILLITALDWCCNSCFSTYFSTTLQVGGYYTAGQATRIDASKKVTGDIVSVLCGIAMKYTKRSKIFVILGIPVLILGHGLLVFCMNRNDVIEKTILLYLMEIFVGFGRGCYQSAAQVIIQAIAGVEGVAMSTAFFMAFSSVGSLIGSSIAGGIWNTVVLKKLDEYLPEEYKANATSIYKSITKAKKFAKGTEARTAISLAYRETIQIIGYAGLGVLAPLLVLMFFIKEVKLTEKMEDSDSEEVEKRTWKNCWRV
uniref:MFS transporter n=1 Tax=Cyberlindnera americana TaxID=36016 RepID=A0A5P8N8F7_9ASCO|nr:MFS transporter [Cyberlindnera americana]